MEGVAHVNVIYCRDYPNAPLPMITCGYPRHPPSHLLHHNRRVDKDKGSSLPHRQDEIIDPSSRRIAFLGADQAISQDVLMVMPYKVEASLVTRSRSGDGRMEFVVIECKNVWNNSLAPFE